MKTRRSALMSTAVLAVGLCGPSVCQVDILNGKDSYGESRLATYTHTQSGNQSWVRQYDGRTFNPFNLELFNTYGYDKQLQYWLGTRDLFIGNEDVGLKLNQRNALGFTFGTSALTHRLTHLPADDPYVSQERQRLRAADPTIPNLVPGPGPAQTWGLLWDSFIDLSPGQNFQLDRRVTEVGGRGNLDTNQRSRIAANLWVEHEGGARQLLFRARQATTATGTGGDLKNRMRGGVAEPISRDTKQGTVGGDFAIGSGSTLSYRYVTTSFDDNNRNWPPVGSALDFSPLNLLTKIKTSTRSHVVKARSKITDRLHFTGVFINKIRDNDSNDIPAGYVSAGQTLAKRVKLNSVNTALVYRAGNSLTFTGRWRGFEMDNKVPPVFRIVGGVPQTTADNQSLSRNVQSTLFEGTYTGLGRTFLRGSYEQQHIERTTNPLHPPHEEFEHPLTTESTNWNIWRAGARWYPTSRLNLSANYENWGTESPGYVGVPQFRTKLDVNGTYLPCDNLGIYGYFSAWNEKNNQTGVPSGSIPTLVTPPVPPLTPAEKLDYTRTRDLAVGQGFRNDFATTAIGAWYALTSKLSIDANYALINMDSQTLWIVGNSADFLPSLRPDSVSFQGNNHQWTLGAVYAARPAWRLRGSFLMSYSNGKSLIDPSIFQGLGPAWTPLNVHLRQWMVGFSHDLSARDRLDIDFTATSWADLIDSSQDGRFSLWRLGWSRQF